MKQFIERLEVRSLLTIVLGADGRALGYTDNPTPAGGVQVAPARTRAGRASGNGDPGFQITVTFGSGLTASQQAAFTTAAHRWESIIRGDLPDVDEIDDVKISAKGIAIDGVGNILGQANFSGIRDPAQHSIPYIGFMQFDTADLPTLESQGSLVNVITHEMGHVLGIGTIWGANGVFTGGGSSNPIFTGTNAKIEYAKYIGTLTPTDVLVENTGQPGTINAHWRETEYANELMTGYLNAGVNPLSRMTAASMMDIGYTEVDLEAADLYTRTNAIPLIGTLNATPISTVGAPISLSLTSATDSSLIKFYRESNGIPGLQATGSTTLDTAVSTISSGLSTNVSTAGLPAGTYTYYAVVLDAFNLQSAYKTATNEITSGIAPPSVPDLDAASDLGTSSTDNITSDNTPTLSGTSGANLTIQLFDGGSPLGTTTSNASGVWSFTAPILSDGTHLITARTSDGVNTSNATTSLSITIDTVAPVLSSVTYDRDYLQDVTLMFGEAVATQVTAGKLTLTNTTTATTVGIGTITYLNGNKNAQVSFTPLLLVNGRYTLSMAGTAVTDAAGNSLAAPLNFLFTQLAGDATGDGAVNFDDLLIVAQNYNSNGKNFSQGNFNYDGSGIVDFSDLLLLSQNYGVSLIVAPIITASSTKRRSDPPIV